MGWTVTQSRMLVAFWSAIAFCVGLILIYFSYLNYKKHKELQREDSALDPARAAPIALDPTPGRRVSVWRTGSRDAFAEAQEEGLMTSPPQHMTDNRGENRKVKSVGGVEERMRPGGDACMDWDGEIW